MQKLVGEEWVDCTEEDLVSGDTYRVPVGESTKTIIGEDGEPEEVTINGWQEQEYNPVTVISISITGDKPGNVMNLGDTLGFTAAFSDLSINATTPVSIVNREGIHILNTSMVIVNGIGTGSFTPDKALDYFITNEAINFHDSFGAPLSLENEFYIRVLSN